MEQWNDWQWQLANVRKKNGVRLTPYLLSLIDENNANDPIGLQHIPQASEAEQDGFSLGAVWERVEDFADGTNRFLQQKYPDIVVLRMANTCHAFCRFCFEKERTILGAVRTQADERAFADALSHIRSQLQIREVLISGGDPLILPDHIILDRIKRLAALPHITGIRLNTRAWLHNPFRLTEALIGGLADIQRTSWDTRERGVQIRLGAHFNHPKEFAPETLAAIRIVQKFGLHIYNQTVLLKGVNDVTETLAELFRHLRKEGVELHYLSHAMPVPGTAHFRTTVRKGQELLQALRQMKEFRGALPHYELSHHTGKQLIPESMTDWFFEDASNIRFLSDMTGHWEIYPDGA